MKKILALVATVGLISAASTAFGVTIVGSKHDLSSTGTSTLTMTGSSTQICIYCHAPHNAVKSLPLWNRQNPSASLFTLYSGVNMQNISFKQGFTSDSTSLFCMSCHDGVTRMNAIHNAGIVEGMPTARADMGHDVVDGVFNNKLVSGAYTLGGHDLSKTHPINFPVSTVDSQSDLNVGTGSFMGPSPLAGSTGKTFPLFRTSNGDARRTTANRSLECGSCHAVHNAEYSPFLRDTLGGSKLCLGCHNK